MSTPDTTLQMAFREVMAGIATPVSVVTAMTEGKPYGTTVSAFASLSMDPPMVLVSLSRDSELLLRLRECGRFGVNVLGSGQAPLAMTFAQKGGTGKFAGILWASDHDLPRFSGAPGWLACTVADLIDGGDHVIALGTVVAAETMHGPPLTYHSRVFGTHTAFEEGVL